MVQVVRTITVLPGEKIIAIERPHVLDRIFFSIKVIVNEGIWCKTKISFDDPTFFSCYLLDGVVKYFEAEGKDIFQGNIWIYNMTGATMFYVLTEILH